MNPHKSNGSNRFWKWRTRSNKSVSESDARDISYASPTTTSLSPSNFLPKVIEQPQVPPSPYVSESAHVFSLQHPSSVALSDLRTRSSISTWASRTQSLASSSNRACHHEKDPVSNLDRRSPYGKIYGKTKRGFGSRFRLRSPKEASKQNSFFAIAH
jgi:hypothetical protein